MQSTIESCPRDARRQCGFHALYSISTFT